MMTCNLNSMTFISQEAVGFVQKVELEEKKIYTENVAIDETYVHRGKVPPAPVLLCRTDTFMVFKPALFQPSTGEKVYSTFIFLCNFY